MGGPSRWVMAGFGFSTFGFAFLVDQVTKMLILAEVMTPPRLIELSPLFNLTLVQNPGTAFGLFAAQSRLGVAALMAMTGLISFGVLLWMLCASSKREAGALGLILGGALGTALLLFLSLRPVQTTALGRLEIGEKAESNRSNAKH
jgi:signal peptidase II